MLEESEIVKLDNNQEYVVTCSLTYLNNNYVYIVNIKDTSDIHFCIHENSRLKEVEDKSLLDELEYIVFSNLCYRMDTNLC